jgi:2-dehydropantoate 2-reductase
MRIAVMGSGGLGGYFGARLAAGGADVRFIARGAHLDAMRSGGLRVEGPEPIHVANVQVTDDPAEVGPVDLVMFCVKLWDSAAALQQIRPMVGRDTAIVSFQNGVLKDDELRAVYEAPHVMGGVGYVATTIERPGVIRQTGPMQRLVFGEFDGSRSARAEAFLAACRAGGIRAELSEHIVREIWQKYVFLVGLSGTTTTMRMRIGPIRANAQTRAFLLDVMREVVAVGRAHGVDLPEDYAELRLPFADDLAPDMTSSMHHDLERGNRLEVRWLAGGVVALGRAKGVATPLNRAIADILALHADGARSWSSGSSSGPGHVTPIEGTTAPLPALTLRAVRSVAVEVPLRYVLGTSAATVRAAPLLLVDVETAEGVVGRAYIFCYRRSAARAVAQVLHDAAEVVAGERIAPLAMAATLQRRFALLGVTGVARMALSALDAALWDALAVAAGVPLATLLGAAPRAIRAYNSCGLGLIGAEAAADEAERLLEGGFQAVKLRLGYPTLDDDLAVTRAVRQRLPARVDIMVDYNQALSLDEALLRGRALQSEGIAWLEEPIRHDDHRGNAALADALELPLQIGENFNGPEDLARALDARACDLVMPDVARIGGVTGWMAAARIAAARGTPMSSHLMPELSGHLLAATPTCHWLEYVDWADVLVQQPLRVENGAAIVADRPGTGLVWDDAAVARHRLD